jgi:hypothetical protein
MISELIASVLRGEQKSISLASPSISDSPFEIKRKLIHFRALQRFAVFSLLFFFILMRSNSDEKISRSRKKIEIMDGD